MLFSLAGIGKYVNNEPIIPLCFEALCSLRWLAAIERIANAITALIENTKDGSALADKILSDSFISIQSGKGSVLRRSAGLPHAIIALCRIKKQ